MWAKGWETGVHAEGLSESSGVGVYAYGRETAVHCEGDLVVTGEYRGKIGPNEGAPFPRPAYDSGWQAVEQGKTITLEHGLGGNPDDYVVDLQFADESLSLRNQTYYGGWGLRDPKFPDEEVYAEHGAYWQNLNSTEIEVQRGSFNRFAPRVRVRIWVCGGGDNQ